MPVISYIDAVTMAIREEMERDSRVFVLGEDVGKKVTYLKQPTDCTNSSEKKELLTPLLQSLLLQA